MKRTLFSMVLCLAAIYASAQGYVVKTLTFEDADYCGSGNVVGEKNWSSLIDDPEYNGTLLYGDGASTYMWYDEGNTELVWDGLEDSGMGQAFWSGGSAISNYYEPDFSQADYTRQLSIPLATSTNQFIVVFNSVNLQGYPSFTNCTPFYFSDDKARIIESVDVINTAYVLNSLTNGDGFAPAATDESQFVVHFEGIHEDGTTSEVTFLLADGRNFVEDWTNVDLTSLGKIKSLRTYVTGSADLEGEWGLNTPGYVALDNIKVRFETETVTPAIATLEDIADITEPEDGHMSISTEDDDDREFFLSGDYVFDSGCMSDYATWWNFGYANHTETQFESLDDQWNNVVGGGYDGSTTYGVAYVNTGYYGPCYVSLLTEPAVIPGFYITNSSYAFNSLTGGDSFAKKFDKGDWFKLTITGYDANDQVTGTKDYYLADLRDEATAYIINDWRYVDLTSLGTVAKIGFEMSSTDNGSWGMNTPAYFCFDNFGAEGTEVLPEKNVVFISSVGYATYVANKDVDFSKSSAEAYTVTGSTINGQVHLTPVTEACSGEALLLKGEEGAHVVYAAANTPAAYDDNMLKAAENDIVADGSQYILAKPEGKELAFYEATKGTTIAAGKAYMEIFGPSVKAFYFTEEDATAINSLTPALSESGAIYNVAGQRINKLQKGINIVNGKKVLK